MNSKKAFKRRSLADEVKFQMLTYFMLQPIHLICVDGRTRNVYILAGYDEELEFQILPDGELSDEPN